MEDLSDSIERIRELGISYGLSDQVIDECLLKAVSYQTTFSSSAPARGAKSPGKIKKKPGCCGGWGRVFLTPFLVMFIIYLIGSYHPPTGALIGRYTANYSYPFFRYVRHITLPVTRNVDLGPLHETQCLVPNPFFQEPLVECDGCMEIKQVRLMTREEAVDTRQEFLGLAEPIVIMEGYEEEITYDEIRMTYKNNREVFEQQALPLFTTIETIHDASTLFLKYDEKFIKNTPKFHAEWYPNKVTHAKAIRSLFKRPEFVPPESEIALEKSIFIDHPKSKPYSVIQGHYPHNYYIQAFGKRRMMLIPKEHCLEVCETVSIALKPRDILYYHDAFWTLETLPVFGGDAGNDVSIGYMASFA